MSRAKLLVRARTLTEEAFGQVPDGDSGAAQALSRQAIAMRDKAGAGMHPDQRNDQSALASLLVHVGRLDEAEPLARAALEEPGPGSGPELIATLSTLVDILCDTGRPDEAEPLVQQSLGILLACPEHPDCAPELERLGEFNTMRDDLAGAAALYREALGIQIKACRPEDIGNAFTLTSVEHRHLLVMERAASPCRPRRLNTSARLPRHVAR